jgi:hypothetical protein
VAFAPCTPCSAMFIDPMRSIVVKSKTVEQALVEAALAD